MNQISKGFLFFKNSPKPSLTIPWGWLQGPPQICWDKWTKLSNVKFEIHRKICTICAGETLMRFASLHSRQHWIYLRPFYSTITKPESRNSQTVSWGTCASSAHVYTWALTCQKSGTIPWSRPPCSPEKMAAADSGPPLRHRTDGLRGCEEYPSHSSPLSQQVEKVWPQTIR